MAAAIIAARNAYISAKDHRMRNMTTHHETDLPWLREFIAESQSLGFTDEAKPQPTAARHRCFAAGEDARLPAWYRRAAAGARRVGLTTGGSRIADFADPALPLNTCTWHMRMVCLCM